MCRYIYIPSGCRIMICTNGTHVCVLHGVYKYIYAYTCTLIYLNIHEYLHVLYSGFCLIIHMS